MLRDFLVQLPDVGEPRHESRGTSMGQLAVEDQLGPSDRWFTILVVGGVVVFVFGRVSIVHRRRRRLRTVLFKHPHNLFLRVLIILIKLIRKCLTGMLRVPSYHTYKYLIMGQIPDAEINNTRNCGAIRTSRGTACASWKLRRLETRWEGSFDRGTGVIIHVNRYGIMANSKAYFAEERRRRGNDKPAFF